jgi:dihydropyrimidine dehydrogenase (NAD+) subunit PreT
MPEFFPPANLDQWKQNFEQIKPLMTATMAAQESARCLFCFDAPCVKACPTSIDIPLFIRQIYTDNVIGSAKTIYASNYFGNICGKVCPTEVLCEGACVYNHANEKPIEIGRLQSFATETAIQSNRAIFKKEAAKSHKIAVIGAGPAGIGAACELSKLGYEVDIFESKSQPSGLALYGVAPYKIENETVLSEIEYLQKQLGFNIHYNHPIQTNGDIARLEASYSAVFLGIGLGNTQNLGLEGEQLPNCVGATEFIEALKLNPLDTFVGKKVVVIGGGNTAMDAASESARMGADAVHLVYRKSKSEMSAYEFEYDLAKGVGVQGVFGLSPKRILGTDKVEGVVFVDAHQQETRFECDMVIRATGQAKQVEFLKKIPQLQTDNKGRIVVNAQFQTTNPKFFASGDAVNGGAEVVNAIGESKKAAQAIHQFLTQLSE